jgi:signal transduction histidine kinase
MPDAERALFRIVQESVANSLRHSGGTVMKVRLADRGSGVQLEIEDNGHGLCPEDLERMKADASLGVGIAGMRERVRQLQGRFSISSNSAGTRVLVSLPAHEEHYVAHPVG